MNILQRYFPFLEWFHDYTWGTLRIDFIAGLTVALVLVPQSMAYAQLAGLPAYYGLYAAFLPPIVANLFGSSRQLATGPVAVVSLMTAAALEPLATAGSEQYVAYAITLALMVGIFQFSLGVLRLGLIVNFLSHPVVNGFTNAAAIIIATSQLSKIFGVYVDKAHHHYETIYRVFEAALDYTHLPTLAMAVLSFAIMITLRRLNRRIPNVLIAVMITTLLSWAFSFENDETVLLSALESETVVREVKRFNAVLAEKKELEELRATSSISLDTDHGDRHLCTRCHEYRAPGELKTHGVHTRKSIVDCTAIALHQKAGLVDFRIDELKYVVASFRGSLRSFRLVRSAGADDTARFFLKGEAPPDAALEKGVWRLQVGNSPFDLNAVKLTGGGAVVGAIPAGLPPLRRPTLDLGIMVKLISASIIIAILGFMEAISIAKAMAAKTKQKLDPNQELIGQGLANIVGCFGQSYAVSGSFSRSAVNLQAGARTGFSNVISGVIVAVVLLFFSPLLYHLPQAVLASIIMMAVFGLLNISGFVHAWRTLPFDGIVSVATFVCTLVLAPHLEWGLFLGVTLSIGGYLHRTTKPRVAILAPHPDGSLRDARRHVLDRCKHIAAIRFDGPLNFANASHLEDEVLNTVSNLSELKHVLICAEGINEIDASGEEMLRHLIEDLRGAGYEVSMCGIKDNVLMVLKRSHLHAFLGAKNIYPTQAHAIASIYVSAHSESEPNCPFRKLMPRLTELSLHPYGSMRDATLYDLALCRHIAVLRFDDPLNYANTDFLEQETMVRLEGRPELHHVLFAAHGIAEVDPSGVRKLCQLVERLQNDGITVSFSGFRGEVLEVLERIDTDNIITESRCFPTQVSALAQIYSLAHVNTSETECPLISLAPRITELALHPDGSLREARRHGLALCSTIAAVRFDGPISLATPEVLEAEFRTWLSGRSQVTHILIVAHTIDDVGDDDAQQLLELVKRMRSRGLKLFLCGFRDHVFEVIGRTGVADEIGLGTIYATEALAVAGIFSEIGADVHKEKSPFERLLPQVVNLSLHSDGSLRNSDRYGLLDCRFIAVLRIDGPLNFATFGYVAAEIRRCIADRADLRHILLAGHGLTALDETASEELCSFITELRRSGIHVSVSGLKDDVLDLLERTGGLETIGSDAVYSTRALAIEAIHAKAHEGADEEHCPLREVVVR